ncbi:MAG: hypothetical protein L6264_05235 [Weeksellaceae bacterium]|nr:hypothetical protein [Bacteroidota bacterium]MCG2780333.1 hypothetical protein [Weeksellaceae bacterium]
MKYASEKTGQIIENALYDRKNDQDYNFKINLLYKIFGIEKSANSSFFPINFFVPEISIVVSAVPDDFFCNYHLEKVFIDNSRMTYFKEIKDNLLKIRRILSLLFLNQENFNLSDTDCVTILFNAFSDPIIPKNFLGITEITYINVENPFRTFINTLDKIKDLNLIKSIAPNQLNDFYCDLDSLLHQKQIIASGYIADSINYTRASFYEEIKYVNDFSQHDEIPYWRIKFLNKAEFLKFFKENNELYRRRYNTEIYDYIITNDREILESCYQSISFENFINDKNVFFKRSRLDTDKLIEFLYSGDLFSFETYGSESFVELDGQQYSGGYGKDGERNNTTFKYFKWKH